MRAFIRSHTRRKNNAACGNTILYDRIFKSDTRADTNHVCVGLVFSYAREYERVKNWLLKPTLFIVLSMNNSRHIGRCKWKYLILFELGAQTIYVGNRRGDIAALFR